ncbi:carbohydrate ABC transporter permease [Alicyclobacillus dauci]|uniref:Sugar ABC transporter permease n=1 Tax=Alicyclobacillus dauci TaxID=1475485 RepID=A0ABY6Z6T0_9BACL|nr:sugar ABC transporter permease [Alicyclobacillus dauci]WAH37964.1 sugar ABC transporter permease [Alicyclobacillus dauci]
MATKLSETETITPVAQPKKARQKSANITERWMLMPSVILLAIISFIPLFYMIYSSFMNYMINPDQPTFYHFHNWAVTFHDSAFWLSWGRTATYAISGLVLEFLLGTALALAIYRLPWGQNIVTTIWMLPLFVAPIVTGLLGRFLVNSTYGLYAWVLQLLGVHTEILGNTLTAMPALILMDMWEWTPLITIIVLAGLQAMPEEPLEAADVDGAHYWDKLRYVILPLIARPLLVAVLVRSMDILRYVDTIMITTEGGPADATKTIGYYLVQIAFQFQDFGRAAAVGLTMLVITILIGQLFVRAFTRGEQQ